MDRVVIQGVEPYDGEYDTEIVKFTGYEWHEIKQLTGLRGGEFYDALSAIDLDASNACAYIALQQAGKNPDKDIIWNSHVGQIAVLLGVDDEENPPSPQESSEDAPESQPETSDSSGDASKDG